MLNLSKTDNLARLRHFRGIISKRKLDKKEKLYHEEKGGFSFLQQFNLQIMLTRQFRFHPRAIFETLTCLCNLQKTGMRKSDYTFSKASDNKGKTTGVSRMSNSLH